MNLDNATPELFAALAKAQNAVENATSGRSNIADTRAEVSCEEGLNAVSTV